MTAQNGTDDLTSLSATTLVDRLRAQKVTPQNVRDAFVARIQKLNPELGAFTFVDADAAADADLTTILAGLPQAAKDVWDVTGQPTTFGTAALPDYIANADSPPMAALRQAGATFVGKTQVPEFALNAYSENLIAPPARNPLDPERTAGGSSGGTAAAVAARMLPAALGNDGGGSIRIPAAACGIIGLKPGRGTVPADQAGVQSEIAGTVAQLTCTGPLARSAEDAGLMMDALMGRTDGYYRGAGRAGTEHGFSSGTLNIGVSTATPFTPDIDISVNWRALTALSRAAVQLAQDGHRIQEAEIRYQGGYANYFTTVWTSALQRNPMPGLELDKLTHLTRSFVDQSAGYSQAHMDHAMAELSALAENAIEQLGQYDVVLTPMLAMVPPKIGEFTALAGPEDYKLQCQFTPYTSMVNVFGLPAISVPVFQDPRSELSWSVQLIGRSGSEAQLLMLAGHLHNQLMG
ncbi:amidase [Micrococcoides hystricis]|uniref:Amidase n=1 Tax=Micrococcoides hystricis TaxID=1572761 RepID=A0ABV6PB95_9MICC